MPLHGRNISDEEKKPMCSHNCASIGCQSSLEDKHLTTVYIVLTSHINKSHVQGVENDSTVWFGKNGTSLKTFPALHKYRKEHQEE